MATITRFEDIEAWQSGRELKRRIYQCSRTGEFARDFALKDQVRRTATTFGMTTTSKCRLRSLDCGGRAERRHRFLLQGHKSISTARAIPKAPSTLRIAGAVHMAFGVSPGAASIFESQTLRCAPANIAEEFEREGNRKFMQTRRPAEPETRNSKPETKP